ncbi:MAG TPA: Ig domain-containing protein [Bryobacteraceae bacterium]|nr:Ig domain-containing protein [Bryobacteraceae bacterium]
MRSSLLLALALLATQAVGEAKVRITTTTLPAGTVGTAYSATLTAADANGTVRWSINQGALPDGLALNTAGTISGTPTSVGIGVFRVVARDDKDSDTQNLSMLIQPRVEPLVIATTSLPAGAVGSAYSATLVATGGVLPYTWSAAGLPAGLSLTGSTIGGTPTAAGSYDVVVSVRDASGTTEQSTLRLAIAAPPLSITTSSLPRGTAGSAYSAPLAATGGTPPYTWSATGLPAGLSVNGPTITGTTSETGSFPIAITVGDNAGVSATTTLTLDIAAALTITTESLPSGTTGQPYSTQLAATGGAAPYVWSVASGTLPQGLSLNAENGVISGTPGAAGASDVRIRVTDRDGRQSERSFSINVVAALRITTTSLPGGAAGAGYSVRLEGAGGTPPYAWSIASGSLPAGLVLDGSGTISGTPETPGNRTFTVELKDAAGRTANAVFTIGISATLSITSPSPLPAAVAGTDYSYSFSALAGLPPYSWSTAGGSLPSGLSLDASTGVLSGRPATAGSFSFTVRVTDNGGSAVTKDFSLTVSGGLAIQTASGLPAAGVSVPYSFALSAAGGTAPYQWSVTNGALPAGLALNTSGAISGTASSAGTFRFTVQVRDAAGATASRELTLAVTQSAQITSTATLPSATAGVAYSHVLQAAGGAAPYRWSILGGSLPAGLSLDAATGTLSGTPSATGDFSFTVRMTDANNTTDSQVFTLIVAVEGTPAVRFSGVPETARSLEQFAVSLTLDRAFPIALSGTLALSFAPDSSAPADDPAIQFSTGGRTVTFTVPANSAQVALPSGLMLQTGSVAGTITLTAAVGAGTNMAQGGTSTLRILRAAPVIRRVTLVRTATGFEVWITGLSNSRDLGAATFSFQQGSSALTTTNVQVDFSGAARDWYQGAGSRVFGSQFTIVQPFTLNGIQEAVAGVTVTLTNAQGASQPVSAQF